MEILLVIQKDEGSVYSVIVPAIVGCYSWGNTIEHAVKNAREAIESHIEVSMEVGAEVIFEPAAYDDVRKEYPHDHLVFVDVEATKLDRTPERINISVPRFVLEKIDSFVNLRHESRSGFIARAALRTISDESKEEDHNAIAA